RYRAEDEWRDRWDPTDPNAMPVAVEAVVEIAGVGPVRQLFQLGAGE
ncbi:MAG: type II secretion system protein GspJ, partial [Sphingomonadaceae bacterium]|nr:type II secretion system protein GspJ [Sphingomonadaceae bacterium]